MNKIVIASDSFKGTLTSMEVADSVETGVRAVFPDCEVIKLNVADGGEGMLDAICGVRSFQKIELEVNDPLGRRIVAPYVILEDGTALIEMAQSGGLPLLRPDERNPMKTSTYGTGEMIADALARGCRKFMMGIGGSATNDAGMGMLSALGYRFLDENGNELPGIGASLCKVTSVDGTAVIPSLKEAEFAVACDVTAPLYGPQGAAYVYAPQKGADEKMVKMLDAGLWHFADIVSEKTGMDVSGHPGAGAAGGLGYAFKSFLNTRLDRGIEIVLDAIGFDSIIKDADLVITGEGRVDSQTFTGKTVYGVAERARAQGVPVMVIAGSVQNCVEIPDSVCVVSAAHAEDELASSSDIATAAAQALLSYVR